MTMGRHHRAAAVLLALLASASLAAAKYRRRPLAETSDWVSIEVVNRCSRPVVFKAGFNHFSDVDAGHACPNTVAGVPGIDICTTDWQTISPDKSVVVDDVPALLWQYAAYVEGTSPALYLSEQSDEAFLGLPDDFSTDCNEPDVDTCVWWSVPQLVASKRLVLRCPGEDGIPPSTAPLADSTVDIINNCSVAVEVKVAYSLAEGADTSGCVINEWMGKQDHLCVTDWVTLEAGEQQLLAETPNIFWSYEARIAADPSYDLGKLAPSAYQAANDTTPCPESDFYGEGYVCHWWAPRYETADVPSPTEPVVVTCDEYEASQ